MATLSNYKKIVQKIPPNVKLLAVSKGKPINEIAKLVDVGQNSFGESRYQESIEKIAAFDDSFNLDWHFIGRLQKNKVRAVIKSFATIQSVDSLPLLDRISRISIEEDKLPNIFLQVKFREDINKTGFSPNELLNFSSQIFNTPNVRIKGLMTILPLGINDIESREIFTDCKKLSNILSLEECSMGMSSNWQMAVDCGATWVRIGSGLFGNQ